VERVGRRDTCWRCGADLHCCGNCSWYDAAYHNQCREPAADRQVDKERANFCEYFRLSPPSEGPLAPAGARQHLEALFRKKRE